jgi:hypothetical protein
MTLNVTVAENSFQCLISTGGEPFQFDAWHGYLLNVAEAYEAEIDWQYPFRNILLNQSHLCVSLYAKSHPDYITGIISALCRRYEPSLLVETIRGCYMVTEFWQQPNTEHSYECNPEQKLGYRLILPNINTDALASLINHDVFAAGLGHTWRSES